MAKGQELQPVHNRVARLDALPSLALVQELKQLADLFGLPPQAVPSLYQAYVTRKKVESMVRSQAQKLSPAERKALVRTKAGTGLSDLALKQIDAYCTGNLVPYNMVAMLQGGPYPLTEARYLHLQMDPRGLKGIRFIEKTLVTDGANPHAVYECEIEFWSGVTVVGESGACSAEEMTEMRRPASLHNIIAQAKTRAFNRAAGRAVVFVGAASPDDESIITQSPPPPGPVLQATVINNNTTPRNPGEAMSWAFQRYGLNGKQLKEGLGYDPRMPGKSAEEMWQDILILTEKRESGKEKSEGGEAA